VAIDRAAIDRDRRVTLTMAEIVGADHSSAAHRTRHCIAGA
jgi:hypothetical protein